MLWVWMEGVVVCGVEKWVMGVTFVVTIVDVWMVRAVGRNGDRDGV